jgi:hypothetical protein
MRVTFKFDGLKELMSKLGVSGQVAADGVRDTVRQSAYAFADQVRADTPVGKTGNLRRGIKVKEDARSSTAVSFEVRNTAPHAHLFEYGFMHKNAKRHIPGNFVFSKAGASRRSMNDRIERLLPEILQAAIDKP